jgi:hypothetical protein
MKRFEQRYTPRLLAAIRRRYEGTDDPMPEIAGLYDISLRTLHRMADRGGWRKREDRPPRDLTESMLSLERSEELLRQVEALAREHDCRQRLEHEKLQNTATPSTPGARR